MRTRSPMPKGTGSSILLVAEERAVRGAEILDEPLAVLGKDAAVPCRQEVVLDDDRAGGRAADEDGRLTERQRSCP